MRDPESITRLGRYEVLEPIASGGMAEVFLARSVGAMGFQRLVALKLIHTNFTRDPEFVKMFIDEARIAMHLHHRNIVQVFDLDEEGGTYFLAMEYIRGTNLYGLYERMAAAGRWFEAPLAMYIVAQVCKGLHFAHTRTGTNGQPMGIVHRDISPQNVLLSFEGEVKITDFGIATAAERLHQTAAGIVKGKYAYMAPERLDDQRVDARVDVFSAGVLLYELLTGENPFAGSNAVETIERVLAGRVPRPSEHGISVPDRLDEICMKALAPRPLDRFSTAHELADTLTHLAMELTYTRAEMASGDAALASLLEELFPTEKARRVGEPSTSGSGPRPSRSRVEEARRPTPPAVVDADLAYVDAPTLLRPNEPSVDEFEGEVAVRALSPVPLPRPDTPADPTIRSMPAVQRARESEDPEMATLPLGFRLDVDLEAAPTPPDGPRRRAAGPRISTSSPLIEPSSDPEMEMETASPNGRRALLGAVVVVGAVLAGLSSYALWRGMEAHSIVEIPIGLESIPAGASVEIDGRRLIQRTPTRVPLLPGTHTVEFTLVGYATQRRVIEVDTRRSAVVSVELHPNR